MGFPHTVLPDFIITADSTHNHQIMKIVTEKAKTYSFLSVLDVLRVYYSSFIETYQYGLLFETVKPAAYLNEFQK